MKLRYIEVFLALAQTPNMRDVAHNLFVSQASISSTLRDLEEEIGVLLFDRLGRSIHLNENGRILRKRLEPLYQQLTNAFSGLSTEGLMGKLSLGVSFTLSNWAVPQVVYNMKKNFPHVELDCQAQSTAEIMRKVESGHWDMGFVEGNVNTADLKVSYLGSEELVIVSSDKNLAGKARHMEDLMQRLWILHERGTSTSTREILLQNLAPIGLHPKQYLEMPHTNAIKRILQNPDTLACLSPHTVELELRHNELYVVPIIGMHFKQHFYCVERANATLTPLRKMLMEEIKSIIQK